MFFTHLLPVAELFSFVPLDWLHYIILGPVCKMGCCTNVPSMIC
nr:MAG TPA: hypothetical protein [Caudoviricetes sp.]